MTGENGRIHRPAHCLMNLRVKFKVEFDVNTAWFALECILYNMATGPPKFAMIACIHYENNRTVKYDQIRVHVSHGQQSLGIR